MNEIYRGIKSGPGRAYRAVEKLATLRVRPSRPRFLPGTLESLRDIPTSTSSAAATATRPREEFFTTAPAVVETKARYGVPWFEAKWSGDVAPQRPAQGREGPGEGYDYQPVSERPHVANSRLGGRPGACCSETGNGMEHVGICDGVRAKFRKEGTSLVRALRFTRVRGSSRRD